MTPILSSSLSGIEAIRPLSHVENRALRDLAQALMNAAEKAGQLEGMEEKEGRFGGACFYHGVSHGLKIASWMIGSIVEPSTQDMDAADLKFARAIASSYESYLTMRIMEERARMEIAQNPELDDIIDNMEEEDV